VHVAPQAVDAGFWAHTPERPAVERPGDDAPAAEASPTPHPFRAVFVGRVTPEKGILVLLEAWRRAALPDAELVVIGPGPAAHTEANITFTGPLEPAEVRNFLAAASVLVMPSIATRTFREPWGLVANEAMHQHLPVIATDAVGAAAGGLVRHERNGLIVPANRADRLAEAIGRMAGDATLRRTLGTNAGRDVAAFTAEAWAAGMAAAVETAGRRRRNP
jgi:glycosyltransferase involved in cell wall biosynthesis